MIGSLLFCLVLATSAYAQNIYNGLFDTTTNQSLSCTAILRGAVLVSNDAAFTHGSRGFVQNSVAPSGNFTTASFNIVRGSNQFLQKLISLNVISITGQVNSTVLTLLGSSTSSQNPAKSQPIALFQTNVTVNASVPIDFPFSLTSDAIKPAASSQAVAVGYSAFGFNLSAKQKDGTVSPLSIACQAVSPQKYATFIGVGGAYQSAPAATPGTVLTTVPLKTGLLDTNWDYNCTFSGISGIVALFPLASSGNPGVNLVASRGSAIQYLKPAFDVVFSNSVIAQLNSSAAGTSATQFSFTFGQVKATGLNINPSSVNLLTSPITSNRITLGSKSNGGAIGFLNPLPSSFNFTAGSSSSSPAYIFWSNATSSFTLYDSSNNIVKTFSGSCVSSIAPLALVTVV